ncbi:MAG: aminoglycoside adenylyltransferase domain-containing protein [Anaerolineae bacterium]
MTTTSHPDVDALLNDLLGQLQATLGEQLVGLYLYGSLVTGDFDRGSSDIDLLAALTSDVDAPTFEQLEGVHRNVLARHPFWRERLETAYLSLAALKTFRTQPSPIAITSPGEPFHLKEAGREYLMNWWLVREKGRTLYGPSPETLIDPIPTEAFLESVREHAASWGAWIPDARDDRPSQAYAILTLCRALYAMAHAEQVSKKRAALWAQVHYPQWASLIGKALIWRAEWRDKEVDHEATFPDTLAFVAFAREQILSELIGPTCSSAASSRRKRARR